jgi:hypothetical protein
LQKIASSELEQQNQEAYQEQHHQPEPRGGLQRNREQFNALLLAMPSNRRNAENKWVLVI